MQSPIPADDDENIDEFWWWRLELMLSTFRDWCQRYFILGSAVSIDEIIVRFYGRSADTFKMPGKPIKQGYKIFALAQDGYIWHFQLASKQHGIAELEKVNELTATSSMVFQMAQLLPKFLNAHFVIYMDNYFTSIPLFLMLRKENIGAVRTTRPLGINFPALLIVLRKKHSTKLEWGTTVADIVDSVLCIRWQDNNFVLGLSTIHTVYKASSWVNSRRNRPGPTSTNAAITKRVFGDCPFRILQILTWVDDYNYNMNGVDLANQHRQPYDTQRIAYRTWVPLLHWILDQAAINAYKIAVESGTWPEGNSGHLKFQRELYLKLLDYSKPWIQAGPHNWIQRPKRQSCVMCIKREKLKRRLNRVQKEAGIEIFRAEVNAVRQVWSGCGSCNVSLCKTTNCFKEWHSQGSQGVKQLQFGSFGWFSWYLWVPRNAKALKCISAAVEGIVDSQWDKYRALIDANEGLVSIRSSYIRKAVKQAVSRKHYLVKQVAKVIKPKGKNAVKFVYTQIYEQRLNYIRISLNFTQPQFSEPNGTVNENLDPLFSKDGMLVRSSGSHIENDAEGMEEQRGGLRERSIYSC